MLSSDTQTFPKYTKREKRKLKKLAATSPSLAFWVTTHEGLIEEEAEKKELPENFALNTFEGAAIFRLHGAEERAAERKAKWACQSYLEAELAP